MGVKQRGLGSFETVEEAEAAVEAALAKLRAGILPWEGEARKNKYVRGEVSLHELRQRMRSTHACRLR